MFFRRERIPPMQARVTSVSPFQRERRDRRKRLGRRTRTVAGRRFTLAGKDDLGEREEEAEYCFKDFHKLEGFSIFNSQSLIFSICRQSFISKMR